MDSATLGGNHFTYLCRNDEILFGLNEEVVVKNLPRPPNPPPQRSPRLAKNARLGAANRCRLNFRRKRTSAAAGFAYEGVEVSLPARCPRGGGEVEETGVVSQYQTEIPQPRVERIEFRIHHGRCRRCRQPVEGRERRQSSQAVGSAASQWGPRAVALAPELNKGLGPRRAGAVLEQGWGLRVSRDGR